MLARKHALTAQILISQFAQEQPTSLLFQVKCARTAKQVIYIRKTPAPDAIIGFLAL
jgi:hypothetical protein